VKTDAHMLGNDLSACFLTVFVLETMAAMAGVRFRLDATGLARGGQGRGQAWTCLGWAGHDQRDQGSKNVQVEKLCEEIRACRICADRFAATHTQHQPRPIAWFASSARILIAGQAPGLRVHNSGRPFTDPSGDRLRHWLGLGEAEFYDRDRVAIVPMGFCFPGYTAQKADLPPPPICARTWREQVMQSLPHVALTLAIGGPAQAFHLGGKMPVGHRVAAWRDHAPRVFPLPHPSWRNTGWLKRNPWFEAELLPVLRGRVKELMK
jgi:uracil-DNA glycosylase